MKGEPMRIDYFTNTYKQFNEDEFFSSLTPLMMAAYNNKSNIREMIMEMVSTYHPEMIGQKDENYQVLAEKSK